MMNTLVRVTRDHKTYWAIKNGSLYWGYIYSDKPFATQMRDKVTPGDDMDVRANWRIDVTQCVRSSRASF